MQELKYDVIMYGATGFTGQLTAAYLDGHAELKGRRWAIAGRNKEKLIAVKNTLKSENVDYLHCPLENTSDVNEMVRSTKMVITTAGPFSVYGGERLLGACAEAGTHYSDLSGEGFWQREMIDAFHDTAQSSGAKIILGGGVDSIPSDLGAYLALKQLDRIDTHRTRTKVTGMFTEYSGSFSGGTLASGAARKKAIASGRWTMEAMRDPYILAPEAPHNDHEEPTLDGMPDGFRVELDFANGALLPFFMAKINAPVVRRSLFLDDNSHNTTYRECCTPSMWLKLIWLYASRGFGYPFREPIKFKPKPGEGPPTWLLKQGGFTVKVRAETDKGQRSRVTITGQGDPGYGATSKMLAELALCVVGDRPGKPNTAGVLTPSTALGQALVNQLQQADGGKLMHFKA